MKQSRAGDLDFGPAAAFDYDALVLDFHDHYLRGLDNRFTREPPVRYFVMGENAWRESATWPPRPERVESLYFTSARNGKLEELATTPATSESGSAFVADPRQPVADPHDTPGAHDYRALAGRDDVLTFETAPLEEDWTIAGNLEARVFASCDCRDFDLWVRVQDVFPDGRAINVTSPGNDVIRASYRDPAAGRRPVDPRRIYELQLRQALSAVRFGKSHRIRVQVSASLDPHLSRNLQTGASEVDSAESRAATITIHHGPAHPSRLSLPRLAN